MVLGRGSPTARAATSFAAIRRIDRHSDVVGRRTCVVRRCPHHVPPQGYPGQLGAEHLLNLRHATVWRYAPPGSLSMCGSVRCEHRWHQPGCLGNGERRDYGLRAVRFMAYSRNHGRRHWCAWDRRNRLWRMDRERRADSVRWSGLLDAARQRSRWRDGGGTGDSG